MNNPLNLLLAGRAFLFAVIVLFMATPVSAQSLQDENQKTEKETNKLLRAAEDNLSDNDFPEAEALYRKAVSKSPENVKAKYNMANMYYSKEKPSQAASRLVQAAKVAETKEDKHKIFHNLGNSFMEEKKYKEAVEAYKNALRNNPKDEETRYNYALAKKMLEENPESGGGGEDEQDQDQTDKEDSNEGEQEPEEGEGENEDQGGDPDEDSQEQPQDQDENGEPDKQPGEGEPQPQQPKPGQLSPEQIKSLLEAMNNEEKKVQDKINAERAKGARTRNEKDW